MAILIIGSAEMPPPKSMDIQYTKVGKTETNAAGDTVMDLLATKRKISIQWGHLSPADAQNVAQAVNEGPFISVTFFDPMQQATDTADFRCTKSGMNAMRHSGNGGPIGYTNIEVELTER